ncbi:uncharacterized protein DSM5745_04190 [Aspergillus mulundensis]|uniref:Carboxylesterase type B domain-containing protein n=1 Tax=Aspergillus mulundensis TaxID=1810919 RepID=A0A3D8SCP6_9EURO|nr:Uncharacterized protein DSM5745_04190 [Aspergillus mulundensis]RDW83864.1 Uncharacterized protein DSM5745_04190 [Aspergillus mulundensis]
MTTRLSLALTAIQIALIAIYFQQPLAEFLNPRPTVIDSKRGITYIGSRSSHGAVEHFQNIFYAEEPTGPRRFAPPVPTNPQRGSVIDATQSGAWCPQGTGDILPFTSRVTNISENCLSLRIAKPTGTRGDAKLPVIVWIHGGGHILNSASDILYEPDGLVKHALAKGRPVIYVGINYRLGLFGFATSTTLIERKETNVGLRDQRAGLHWIRDNIEAFGGNPNQVTVIGQSVGAADIGLQLVAYGGEEQVPFQQALMMSGAIGTIFNTQPDLVASNTAAIAQQVGCVTQDGHSQNLQTLECLRKISFETLTNLSVAAARAARPLFGEGFFYPTIDNDFIQDRPSQLIRAGKLTKGIPVIASWVTNDGAWYAPSSTSTDEEVLGTFGLWLQNLSESTNKKLLELYPQEDFTHMVRPKIDGPTSPQYYRAAQMSRDIWFTCPVLDFTWQYVQHGGVKPSHVRLYEFNQTRYAPVFEEMGVPMWRVSHLSDIPYLFNIDHLGGGADNSEVHRALAEDFSSRIIQYAYGALPGVENSDGEPGFWPPAYSDDMPEQSHISVPSQGPKSMSIQLFGGPYGSGPVSVFKDAERYFEASGEAANALYWEKLYSRCEFINGEQFRAEAGV